MRKVHLTFTKQAFRLCIAGLMLLANVSTAVQVNWQGPAKVTIKDVRYPEDESELQPSEISALFIETAETETIPPYPVPPLAGFSPLIVITASDKNGDASASEYEHILESSYTGEPLTSSVEPNFIIGIYDSGAVIDLVAGTSAEVLGISGSYLTSNEFPIGGVGGQVNALLSYPIGIFAAGLDAVNPNATLDTSKLKGHSNVSVVTAPEISCSTGETITGVVGTPFISFYTAAIRNDLVRNVSVNGTHYSSPDVQIYPTSSSSIPEYPRKISMELSGLSLITSATYYPDFEDLETPFFPTMLGTPLGIPLGGAFFTTIYVVEGEPGPTNPLQAMRVMVDTGAQSSIISPSMAAKLSLSTTPDFSVDVCGVGGSTPDVPGYNVDYVKINALGGAMEFSNAPFVMLDISSPDGQTMDGILGMNFFWNRNIIFDPIVTGSSLLQVSDPVPFGNADFDFDGSVNLADFALLASAWMSQSPEAEYLAVCDLYLDSRIDNKDLEAFKDHWLE